MLACTLEEEAIATICLEEPAMREITDRAEITDTAEMAPDGERWRIRRLLIDCAWFDGDPLVHVALASGR
jgi:hypothetical protein